MAIFPESMERTDPQDPRGSIRTMDEYVRYMVERIEFGFRNMTKSVNAAGVSSTEVYILLVAMDNRLSSMESRLNSFQASLNSLQNTVTGLQTQVNGIVTDTAEALEALEARVAALEGDGTTTE